MSISHPFMHPCSRHPSFYPSNNFTIHLPFNLFDKCLLSVYSVPDTELGTWDASVNKMDNYPSL